MSFDVDFLRNLLFRLELRQVSPRSTIIIQTQVEAQILGQNKFTITDSLNYLHELGYIDGPGAEGDDIWLFRKLTPKGDKFVDAARDPRDWQEIKGRRKQNE
jgi:hypothetical protein